MFWLPISLAAVTVLSIACAVLLALHCREASRRVKSHMQRAARKTRGIELPPVALIAPVKGTDIGLEENLAALFELDYPDYEIVFVVEAESDPAAEVIDRLIGRSQVRARRIVAGLSETCGQKVHNLRAAIGSLDKRIEAIAFVDADARPGPEWLRLMVGGMLGRKSAAVTGYRWMLPQRTTLPNLILCSMNAACAGMLGRHRNNLVWGGSWTIMRSTFDEIGLGAQWHRTLSDDLVAGSILRRRGTPVDFEPGALCASPTDVTWPQLLEFARRQFMIGRWHAKAHWRWGLAAGLLMQAVMWGHAVHSVLLLSAGQPGWNAPAGVAAALYLIGCYRAWCRQSAACAALPEDVPRQRAAYWFDLLFGPAVGLFMLGIMFSSAIGNRLTWRGVTYRLDSHGKILSMQRDVIPIGSAQKAAAMKAHRDKSAA